MKYLSLLASALLILISVHTLALESNTLTDTSWELTRYNGEPATGTLKFTNDTVYSKFCNNVSQKYTYDGTTLSSDGMGMSTLMYCEGLPMILENNFNINAGTHIIVTEDTLTLTTAAYNIYTFKKTAAEIVPPIVGGDRDEHGCIPSAGYSWDGEFAACVRPWEVQGLRNAFDFAVAHGITSNTTIASFERDNTITRQEAAAMLIILARNVYQQSSTVPACKNYLDDDTIGNGFKRNVYEACAQGLMVGSQGYFIPHGSITRGQALSVMIKMVDGQAQTPTTPFWDAYVKRAQTGDLLTLEGKQDFEAPITRGEFIEWAYTIYGNYQHTLTIQESQKSLDAAKLLWSKNKPTTYTLTQTVSCFCAPSYTQPQTFVVKDGMITNTQTENMPELLTVEGAFAVIQDALDKNAAQVTVEYDATLGFPHLVSIDYSVMIADEEKFYTFDLTK